jgi:hypothetical protein
VSCGKFGHVLSSHSEDLAAVCFPLTVSPHAFKHTLVPKLTMFAVVCREEAQKVWRLKEKLDAMGVGLAAVIHEYLEKEVQFLYMFSELKDFFYSRVVFNWFATPLVGSLRSRMCKCM